MRLEHVRNGKTRSAKSRHRGGFPLHSTRRCSAVALQYPAVAEVEHIGGTATADQGKVHVVMIARCTGGVVGVSLRLAVRRASLTR